MSGIRGPIRLHAPDEETEIKEPPAAKRVSVRQVVRQNREQILDRFHQELKLAQLQPDGETLALADFLRLPLSPADEKWNAFQIDTINQHLLEDSEAVGDGSRIYEAVPSPRKDGGGIDLLVRPRPGMTRRASAMAAQPVGWRDKAGPLLRKAAPFLVAASAVLIPMIVPRIRNYVMRFVRLRQLQRDEPNLTSSDLQTLFTEEQNLNADGIGSILRAVHKLSKRRNTNLVVHEPIVLETRNSKLTPLYADSHGRVSMLDNAGYHMARNLERGELVFVEQKRDSSIVDEVYLGSGTRLSENEDWYDFNRITKSVLDKRPVLLKASTDLVGAAAALLILNASLQVSGGWTWQSLSLAGVAAALALFSAGMFIARTRRRLHIREQLKQSYMEFRADLPGDEYVRLTADAHGAVPELEEQQVFLLHALRPGQELFVQRNDQSEIVNIFDLQGQHLQFFDGSRRFYADVEELDSPALLAPWFTGTAALAGVIACGVLLGQDAPLHFILGFFASLAALLASAFFLILSVRKRSGRRAVLDYIIHRLKRNEASQAAVAAAPVNAPPAIEEIPPAPPAPVATAPTRTPPRRKKEPVVQEPPAAVPTPAPVTIPVTVEEPANAPAAEEVGGEDSRPLPDKLE
jgi:hypothetical protein